MHHMPLERLRKYIINMLFRERSIVATSNPGDFGKLLTTSNSTPPPLTSLPLAPSQPSKQSSPLAINLDPGELIFSTPPTSPHPFFDSLEDIPLRTINLPPPRPSFDTIERLANQPPPLPAMEPPLPPLPPQLTPLGPNNPFPWNFYDHCQHTQVIVSDLCEEIWFILNHILEHLDVLAHKNNPFSVGNE
nr:hypothetical protein [Tanacetum cinerariifolium]